VVGFGSQVRRPPFGGHRRDPRCFDPQHADRHRLGGRICKALAVQVGAFRGPGLCHVEFPYAYLDATYVNTRDTARHQIVARAVMVVIADATRERPDSREHGCSQPVLRQILYRVCLVERSARAASNSWSRSKTQTRRSLVIFFCARSPMDRASDYGSEGWAFESPRAR
jgi:hypothetical protein